MTLLLTLLIPGGLWATGGTPAGSGTSGDPYVIADADDWATFVTWINNSNSTYGSKYYKLGGNITISSMAGTSSYKFKGTFDGCGYTMTLNNLTSTGEFCAPFRYVDGATFKRIHTTGTVIAGSNTSNDKYRTGLVGESRGTVSITNCWSSVNITSEIAGDGTHGGLVGVVNGGTLTITNCLFDGTITGSNTYANGGFVGWTGSYTTNITNCLMVGTITSNTQNGATFMRGDNNNVRSNIKVNNSYYGTAYGTVQGTAVGEMTNAQLQTALGSGWEISGGKVVPIMSANNLAIATVSGLATPYYIWTGSPIAVDYTVTDANGNTLTKGTDYTATISPATVQDPGEYTLTITGKGSYTGTKVVTFEVRRILEGSGTAADPYLIGSDTDWETFVGWINNENSTYRAKYYKLTADINVTSTAGTSQDVSFRGTFDGDGHTMTLNLTSDGDYCAPFRYCYNTTVTIKRLHVTGTINTSHRYAAGLVGYQYYGTLNIINCWSSVTINSSTENDYADHAGFVGYTYANINITNSRFDGKLLGASSNGWGGFVGYKSGSYTINVNNCLYAPTEVTGGANNNYTFVRSDNANINNCYYTETLGTEQGAAVGSMTNAELQEALGHGWEISNGKVVPILDLKNLTAGILICNTFFPFTGSEVTVTPTVKDMDGNVIAAENYGVVFSPSPVQASGNYTMTVTGNANGYSGTLTHAFRVAAQLSGAGTEAEPYIIASTSDWNKFAEIVNGGYNYEGEFVKLTADIDNVTTMVGLRENGSDLLLDAPFKGTFDGDNHTLTAAIVSTATGTGVNEQGVAPFHYIKHATIKNLTVAGSITSDSQYTGGLVGLAGSNAYSERNTINDCVVTATLTIGANYAGGLVGNIVPYGSSYDNYTYLTNCVFAGTIQSSTADLRQAGGMFGYGYAYCYMTNCLENGTYANLSLMNPRGAYSSYNNYSVNSLYYVNRIGSYNSYVTDGYGCHQVVAAVPTEDIYLTRTIKGYTVYQPAILSDLMDTYAYNNGEAVSVNYTLKMGSTTMTKDTDYEVTIKNSSDVTVAPEDLKELGTYTIHFTAKAGNEAGYTGETVRSFQIMVGESLDGYVFAKDGDDYVIGNEDDLKRLAAYVNSGHEAVGLTFKLTANITMTAAHTAIGGYINNNTRYFRGTFDGNNKTISNLTINKPSEDYQGLFGLLGQNALVKDVTVDGYNITGKRYVGAIAGYANNSSSNRATIQNCHANGTNVGSVASADYHGGIAGYGYYVDITGCTSQGTISTTAGNVCYGGIIGYASSSVNVTSCENAASITGSGDKHGGIVGDDDSSSNRYSLCLNTGTVEGSSYKGGIAGERYYTSNFTNCYYASPCTVMALDNYDSNGHGERGYIVTAGSHIASISAAEAGVVESVLSGKKYYKKGDWTLTLTPTLSDETFITYACEGGTLTNLDVVDGTHKLTITDQDVTISALVSSNSGVDMSTVTVADIADQRWKGGEPVIPAVTVTDGGTPLVEGTDYLVEATGNTAIGTATATLTGINGYKGTTTKTFNIVDFPLLDPLAANSSSNPYLVADEKDLQALAGIVNSGARQDGYYKQTANITLTEEHTAIGSNSNAFRGSYNGNDKTISGLVINQPSGERLGLFGNTSGATVQHVIVVDCDITARYHVGGIVGSANNSTNISYCTVSGALKIAAGVQGYDMGGIVGYSSGSLTHCVNTASITGNGTNSQCLGGIAGYNSDGISDNFNAGAVTGATGYVGSIVGQKGGSLTNNYHTVTTVGGVGAEGKTTSADETGAEVVVKITAAAGVTLTLPAEPTYVWNEENLYKSGTEVTLNYAVPAGKVFDCYTVNSGEISNAGIIDGTHALTGFTEDVVITGTYANEIINLATAGAVIADIATLTYNGSEQHPVPVVTLSAETLQEGSNYTVSYSDGCINAGNYTVTVTGTGRYTGSVSKNFTINPFNIENCEITMENPIYTGSEIELNPTVKRNGTTMTKDADYTITTVPAEVLEVGDYTMTITGLGNYTGTKEVDFQVLKRWTIGSGNSGNNALPFHNYYNYALTQQIFTAAEMGNQAGNILSIDLRETSTKDCKRTMDIYMVNTDKSSFENSADWIKVTDADKVYSGQVVFPDNDWATITLDTPFMYDGTGNLAIIFDANYRSANGDTYSSGCSFLVYDGASNQTLYQYSDGTNLDPQSDITTTGSLASNKNQVRLVINRHDRIEMNAHGVMTYASDNVLDFTNVSGLTATYASNFVSTGSHSGTLTMTQAETVPAGEGLFLKGTANETYYVPVIDAAAALAPANMLVGLTTPTLVPQVNGDYTNFIFAKHGDDFGWYRLAADYTLKAHSAYLPLLTNSVYTGGGAIAITMDFGDGEVTDINKVEADDDANADGDWYTLDGLKLEKKPTKKGVYIKDGRKVVVK